MSSITFAVASSLLADETLGVDLRQFFHQLRQYAAGCSLRLEVLSYEVENNAVRYGRLDGDADADADAEHSQAAPTVFDAVAELDDAVVCVHIVQRLPDDNHLQLQREAANAMSNAGLKTLFQIQLLRRGPKADYFPSEESDNSFFALATSLPERFPHASGSQLAAIKRARADDTWRGYLSDLQAWLQDEYGPPNTFEAAKQLPLDFARSRPLEGQRQLLNSCLDVLAQFQHKGDDMNRGNAKGLSAVAGAAWLVTDTVTAPPAAMKDDDVTQTTAKLATSIRAPAIFVATEEFQCE